MKKTIFPILFCLFCISQTTNAQDSTATQAPVQGYDKAPQYPGGEQKMIQFIMANFRMPASAVKDGVGGTVLTQFLVNIDGKLTDIKIKKGVRKDLNDEALRLVRMMGNWEAGSLQGKPVAITYTLPFNFGSPAPAKQATAPAQAPNGKVKLPKKGWGLPATPVKKN